MPIIQTATIRTYYKISGQGEALVFIHGLGSSSQDWSFQTAFFPEYFRTIAYDVRGHGQSEKAKGPYSVQLFAKDLAALLADLGIIKAHLVGLSMGGWIAFQFAVDFPEMTNSLTIVNSWADMRPKSFYDYANLFRRNILFRLFSMRKIGEILGPKIFIKPEQKDLLQNFIESWAENHKPSYMASMKAGTGWSVADQLDKITCPVLVVAADEDYTPVEAKQKYVDELPDARLEVIEDSRHATPVEHPDEFNRLLLDFLQART
ncbi:MAG: alpha/beta hydrolase [Anaerolineales bacterium]|uniref:Alpha/beta hydrolase n=1 Tax=Candidatus Desulfolinea nitratireducens TaxID=2841698 RepID=A0A8J6NF22_9CHLR|nr:alpha/beta hydrolase [Candidatus Desulfolinea nitratireducens]MBL6960454.1 alpha/beta hydrolase [Anaerolineales bacterium]